MEHLNRIPSAFIRIYKQVISTRRATRPTCARCGCTRRHGTAPPAAAQINPTARRQTPCCKPRTNHESPATRRGFFAYSIWWRLTVVIDSLRAYCLAMDTLMAVDERSGTRVNTARLLPPASATPFHDLGFFCCNVFSFPYYLPLCQKPVLSAGNTNPIRFSERIAPVQTDTAINVGAALGSLRRKRLWLSRKNR